MAAKVGQDDLVALNPQIRCWLSCDISHWPHSSPFMSETNTAENPELVSENSLQSLEHRRPETLPVLPIDQRPLFPGLMVPLTLNEQGIHSRIQRILQQDEGYCAIVLRDRAPKSESESAQDSLRDVGTLFRIVRVLPLNEDNVQVLGQSMVRLQKVAVAHQAPELRWKVRYQERERGKPGADLRAYMMAISNEVKQVISLNPHFKEQINLVVDRLNYESPGLTLDVLCNLLNADREVLQELLEKYDPLERAKQVLELVRQEVEVAKIQQHINEQIAEKVNEQQREFFLREQLRVIKKELGIEKDGPEAEVEALEERLEQLDLPEDVRKVADQELRKLGTLNAQSPEFNVSRSYLELIADLPWGQFSEDVRDIKKARSILDQDHYGLEDVKDSILEFLATIIRKGSGSGSIICLVGPPGVGKTSIGKSIAQALGRKFYRFSVGGMRDEAEIKGHRRTYIGAMPGKLIQAIRRVETSNPVIMLDEIDKIGASNLGDPASALLEVLDPEQNSSFVDHYLDVPYDLSNVLFITTANSLDPIPRPLLDRMEVISLSGYLKQEKVEIARRYLLPKLLKELAFAKTDIKFSKAALEVIVEDYAREAGVRNLEKLLRKVLRKISLRLAENPDSELPLQIGPKEVAEYLGKAVFNAEELYNKGVPGVALGMAYTPLGGATLYIEATGMRAEKGSFHYTGQLGDVMKESADIAYSYVRAKCAKEGNDFFDKHSVHLHVPAGATPKDGPSAGITMALALYSLGTGRAVREGLAMTGELTLTGKVLPIGGVREKTIGARRVGIKKLLFPKANKADWDELPDFIKSGVEAHFADYFDDVLAQAFPAKRKTSAQAVSSAYANGKG